MEQMKVGIIGAGRIAEKYGENTGPVWTMRLHMPLLQEILTERRNLPKNGDLKRHMAHTKNW